MILLSLVAPLLSLAALPARQQVPRASGVIVSAADEEGFGVVGERWDAGRELPIPIPLVTRCSVVQRAVPGSRGIRLRLTSAGGKKLFPDDVSVRAFRHSNDSQVLVGRDTLLLVGPPTLPREVSIAQPSSDALQDALPLFARQDGLGTARPVLRLIAPEDLPAGHRLVAITAAPRSRTARVFEATQTRLDDTDLNIDQLFYASVRSIDSSAGDLLVHEVAHSDGTASSIDEGEFLELILPAPPGGESDRCWTLLVSLKFKAAVGRTAAAIPRAAVADRGDKIGLWTDGWQSDASESLPFVHLEGPDLQLDIRPTMGPGLACGDIEGDGDPDLYLVQGGGRANSRVPTNRLLENRSRTGAIVFRDRTAASGTGHRGAGMGALFFDAEGDGDLDLFVANYGADVLFINDGRGVFSDRSEEAGIGGNRWSAGIAAADTDLDGDLDLYITSYLDYDESKMPPEDGFDRYRREDPVAMLPFAFPGDRNVFLRNDSWMRVADALVAGPLRFTDLTDELGLADEQGRGMQPVFWDFDRDGDPDLYVANDVSFNTLWRNDGKGQFTDVSFATGMDDPRGGMGVSIGDADGDGDEDLFLTNWQLEPNALYINNLITHRSRKSYIATFRDSIVRSKMGRYGVGATSWGAELFDADLDGDLDLFVANGYTSPDYESTGICVGQPNHFFLNDGEGRFEAAFDSAPLKVSAASRAVVACDFDRDGDPDLIVTSNNGPVALLQNHADRSTDAGWLGIRLRGQGANTHAIGAEVSLRANGRLQRRSLRAGSSYLAGNPPELLFGLGAHEGPLDLTVRWPSGRASEHRVPATDRHVVIEEPE